MVRSVTDFLWECGFEVKLFKSGGGFRAKIFENDGYFLEIGKNSYYNYYCKGGGNKTISDMCTVCADTFPVMLELAYDCFHDANKAIGRPCKIGIALERMEDEITSMFDRIMGEWE